MLFQLVYVSSATRLMSNDDLTALLIGARKRNIELDVTGLLLYADGNFIQLLEGPKDNLNHVYQSIVKDSRHKNCTLLTNNEIDNRHFPHWSMGIKHLNNDELTNTPGLCDFLERKDRFTQSTSDIDVVIQLLYMFRDNS